jgi:hypothetical protein
MAFAIAGPWLAGCAAADEGVPDSEVLGEERAALEFRSVDYDDGSVNQCVFDGLSMHCCPGNAPTETRWVMIGAHLDLNVFKCAELEPPTYAPPFVDRFTTREGMRACPPNSAMVGFHRDADELACIPLYRAMSESVDYGTQDDFQMHVCPFGQVMSGINDAENQFLCAE